jgi:ribosome-associated protein
MTDCAIKPETLRQMAIGCVAMDDKKAMEMRVMDVRGKSSITDFLIIATGTSEPHLRAIGSALETRFKELDLLSHRTNHEYSSGWVVIDMFDFIVHIFNQETRKLYNIEGLWKDSEDLEVGKLIKSISTETVKGHKSA